MAQKFVGVLYFRKRGVKYQRGGIPDELTTLHTHGIGSYS